MELKAMAANTQLGFSLDDLREFVRATEGWPGDEYLDCYVPAEGGVKVAALMGLYATADVKCPRCKVPLHGEPVNHSLSRIDNTTRICSSCGTDEAMWDHLNPSVAMPPLDRRAR